MSDACIHMTFCSLLKAKYVLTYFCHCYLFHCAIENRILFLYVYNVFIVITVLWTCIWYKMLWVITAASVSIANPWNLNVSVDNVTFSKDKYVQVYYLQTMLLPFQNIVPKWSRPVTLLFFPHMGILVLNC